MVDYHQGSNFLGITPLAYSAIVLAFFLILQQIENNVLVPRIIGRSLNMSPLAVLISILAGGMIAGVLGLIIAAPVAASLRLILGYIYRKTVGFDDWMEAISPEQEEPPPQTARMHRLVSWLRSRLSRQDRVAEGVNIDEPEIE